MCTEHETWRRSRCTATGNEKAAESQNAPRPDRTDESTESTTRTA